MGYADHLSHNYERYIKGILPSESFSTLNITESVRRREDGFSPPKLKTFLQPILHTICSYLAVGSPFRAKSQFQHCKEGDRKSVV